MRMAATLMQPPAFCGMARPYETCHVHILRVLEPCCPEHDLSQYSMDGYYKLASLMSDHEELFMLRRFATANTKNLLYMQAEILHLEAELHDIALEDHSGCERHRNYEFCVFDLKESHGVRGSDAQWRKILEIREKLKEYSQSPSIARLGNV